MLGGTTTLIGTPPNLLMADLSERLRGDRSRCSSSRRLVRRSPLLASFSSSRSVGGCCRAGGKGEVGDDLFEIGHYVTEARLPAKSSLIGKTIREFEDASGDSAVALGLVHGDTRLRPSSSYVLQEGDVLLLQAETQTLQDYVKASHIDLVAAAPHPPPDLPSAEASVPRAPRRLPRTAKQPRLARPRVNCWTLRRPS